MSKGPGRVADKAGREEGQPRSDGKVIYSIVGEMCPSISPADAVCATRYALL
jgi:hypothetical protein